MPASNISFCLGFISFFAGVVWKRLELSNNIDGGGVFVNIFGSGSDFIRDIAG